MTGVGDCPICQPPPVPSDGGPGVPLVMPGTRHRSDCPTLPKIDQAKLAAFADEVQRCRLRALQHAATYVIGAAAKDPA